MGRPRLSNWREQSAKCTFRERGRARGVVSRHSASMFFFFFFFSLLTTRKINMSYYYWYHTWKNIIILLFVWIGSGLGLFSGLSQHDTRMIAAYGETIRGSGHRTHRCKRNRVRHRHRRLGWLSGYPHHLRERERGSRKRQSFEKTPQLLRASSALIARE